MQKNEQEKANKYLLMGLLSISLVTLTLIVLQLYFYLLSSLGL